MAREKFEDRGFDSLRNAGRDPAAAFFLRILGPGIRQEVGRVQRRVSSFLDDVSEVFLEAEGKKPSSKGEVIDAEIVEETPSKKKAR